ncbi:MAG TPA: hypothetical protein VJG30_04175 [Candidatus Nanoarchaeia archaeon]|nr:hypothetical protein [Candidatus Nanoarchaeia archaeon]
MQDLYSMQWGKLEKLAAKHEITPLKFSAGEIEEVIENEKLRFKTIALNIKIKQNKTW